METAAFEQRCRRLRLILADVDGVLTDGRLFYLPGGGEAKAFHVRDGMGVLLARNAGLKVGLLSGRASPEVTRRAAETGMDVVRQGISDKRACLRELLGELGLVEDQVGYIGDDVNDLAVMKMVGLSAAPADAARQVRQAAALVTERTGGEGCLREFVEAILNARGELDDAVRSVERGA